MPSCFRKIITLFLYIYIYKFSYLRNKLNKVSGPVTSSFNQSSLQIKINLVLCFITETRYCERRAYVLVEVHFRPGVKFSYQVGNWLRIKISSRLCHVVYKLKQIKQCWIFTVIVTWNTEHPKWFVSKAKLSACQLNK